MGKGERNGRASPTSVEEKMQKGWSKKRQNYSTTLGILCQADGKFQRKDCTLLGFC